MIQPPDYKSYIPGSRCNACGHMLAEQKTYPRICFHCGHTTYKNPIPVAVAIVPVHNPNAQCSWLIQQRNIEPKKGGWAFPSGYIDFGETWQQAVARELEEEVGLIVSPGDFHLVNVLNAANGNMLLFGAHKYGVTREQIHFQPNEEVSAIDFPVLPEHQELCFPTHNEVWKRYYDSED